MIDPWLTLPFHRPHKEWFQNGGWRLWAEQYPMLFDGRDREKAVKQAARGHYFKEWLSAVTLFNRYGYRSLFGQYSSPSHERKTDVVDRIAPVEVRRVLREKKRFGRTRPPDLFVYSADGSEWFVAEVKGWTEQVQPNQLKLFKALEQVMGEPVRVIRLKKRS